ncbi:glycosyltransferase family 2 protein [candidate division WOR-3 bacterium]|nr:glycosyltransferase family 2 protein [candidate division WOR-3 bacterium]
MGSFLACLETGDTQAFKEDMTLTIGIVNYNTKEDLKKCIKSLLQNPPDCDYQIVIVDNNSKDGSKSYIKKLKQENIKYILNKKNNGFGAACNQIAQIQNSSYVLFLNPDVEVSKNSIDRLIRLLKKDKKIGVATGKLLYPNGSLQLSCRKFPTILRVLFGRESVLRKIFPNNMISKEFLMSEVNYDKIQFPDCVRGAVMLFKTEIFKKIGGFDEKFFLFFEDTDICLRLRKKGYEIVYLPDAVFYHSLGGSTKKEKLKTKIAINISMFYYIRKNMNYNFLLLSLIFIALITRLIFVFIVLSIKESRK